MRSATQRLTREALHTVFQFTRSMRSATNVVLKQALAIYCFNSHAPCGARQAFNTDYAIDILFQFTRSMRSATHLIDSETDEEIVSIHTLHAERDLN